METEIKTSLSTKLVSLRKQKGLTQMELAEKLNVSRQAISRWEVGVAVPSTDNLKVLGELYGVRVDYLLNDDVEFDSKKTNPVSNNQVIHEKNKREEIKILIVSLLIIIITILVLFCWALTRNREQDLIIPVDEMSTGPADDYSEGIFIIE